MSILSHPDGKVNGVRIRLAIPEDYESLLNCAEWAQWRSGGSALPQHIQERLITSLLPRIENGRIIPSGEGFIVIAEGEKPIGCLYCEFQRFEASGQYVACLSNLFVYPGSPLRTAHRMMKFAGGLIWNLGVCKVMITVDGGGQENKSYQSMGCKPVCTVYEADLSEGMAQLKKRKV